MKRVLTFKNTIFLIIVLGLLLFAILLLNRTQKVERAAIILMQVSQVRTGLSSYMAQLGIYPAGEGVILGSSSAGLLCLGESLTEGGFLPADSSCEVVLLDLDKLEVKSNLVYTSLGAGYQVEFIIPSKLGAFQTSGYYCATEKGVLVGRCH